MAQVDPPFVLVRSEGHGGGIDCDAIFTALLDAAGALAGASE